MSKVTVELTIPAASIIADVEIPYECQLLYVVKLLKALFGGQADRGFLPSDRTMLCWKETGQPVDLSKSAQDCGIDNSTRLMLV